MKDIPWLTEVLTALATDSVTAAEDVLERVLEDATPEERAEVAQGWVEMLVAEQKPLEAIALLDALIANEASPANQGQMWWRLARILAATGLTERVAHAVEEALRLDGIRDAGRIQVAADAIGSVDPSSESGESAQAYAVLLGTLNHAPTPTTVPDLLQLAWTMVGAAGERARAAGEHELESWSAVVLSMISGMMGELDGAIQLAEHAAAKAVEGASALAFSEATRSRARWVMHRDGHDASGDALRDAQRTWDAHFADVPVNPIAEWMSVWSALEPQ